jgi:8-amino-7-oxononanoate synthase
VNYYESELKALKRSNRYRSREIFDENIIDLASNDYLCLSHNKELLKLSCDQLYKNQTNSSKASMLVNGYHQIHRDFESALCEANGFEDGVIIGSGFSANIAMIEALIRGDDELFIDEKYHASGILATKLLRSKVTYFSHNDDKELRMALANSNASRKIIAVEGVYSMDGDLLNKNIISLADEFDAILIVDEAHSSGVVGNNLMGIFDHYNVNIKPHYIKMGTLGKAYGSFGGYILASSHIIEYLINRAKPIIYATAPSLFDTLLAHNGLNYIKQNSDELKSKIKNKQQIVNSIFETDIRSLIFPIIIGDNKKVLEIQKRLREENILVGAIRQPTVKSAIIRLIARVDVEDEIIERACMIIKDSLES